MVDSSDVVVGAALLVAAVAAVLMWSSTRKARATTAPSGAGGDTAGLAAEALLLKFVDDEAGRRRGETVALDGDRMVLKSPEGFYAVPASQLRAEGAVVRIVGDVDWEEARRQGDAWRERSHRVVEYRPEELPKDEP